MAEMLVRAIDKVNLRDEALNARCLKRGMVVVICPDGWPWSKEERTSPEWAIVQVPGATVEELAAYTKEPERVALPHPLTPRRTVTVDLGAINAAKRGALVIAKAELQTFQLNVAVPDNPLVL